MSEASVKKRTISELSAYHAVLEGCIDRTEKIFITSLQFTIGNLQSRTASYVIDDEDISENHCVIKYQEGVWLIQDHSMSGTYVNGLRLDKHDPYILLEGQKIRLGVREQFTYIFSQTDCDFECKRNKTNFEEDFSPKTSEPLAIACSSRKPVPEDYNHMINKIVQIRTTVIREVRTVYKERTMPENECPAHLEYLQSGINNEDECLNKSLFEEKEVVGGGDDVDDDVDDDDVDDDDVDDDDVDDDDDDDDVILLDDNDVDVMSVDNDDDDKLLADDNDDDDNASHEESDIESCQQKQIQELQLKISESEKRETNVLVKTIELCDLVQAERTAFTKRLQQEQSAAQQALENQKRQMQELEKQKRQMAEEKSLQEQSRKKLEEKLVESEKSQIFEAFVKKEVICGICDEVLLHPVKLSCPHIFCHFCINKWSRRRPRCPLCRAPVTVTNQVLAVDSIVNKIVETLPDKMKRYREELDKGRQAEEASWVDKAAAARVQNSEKFSWRNRRAIRRYVRAAPMYNRQEHVFPVFVQYPSYSDSDDSETESSSDSDCDYEDDEMGSQSC